MRHGGGVFTSISVYFNKLQSPLTLLTLTPAQVVEILQDVQTIKHGYFPEMQSSIVITYAERMRNGWWLMFACVAALFLLTFLAKHFKFQAATSP